MSSREGSLPTLIIDVRGLEEWANLSENEAGAMAGLYDAGDLAVAAPTWNEFADAYPESAEKLDVPNRMRVTQSHRLAAAALADDAPLTGLPTSARPGDFCVAGIAKESQLTIVTCVSQKKGLYKKLGIQALTISEILEQGG